MQRTVIDLDEARSASPSAEQFGRSALEIAWQLVRGRHALTPVRVSAYDTTIARSRSAIAYVEQRVEESPHPELRDAWILDELVRFTRRTASENRGAADAAEITRRLATRTESFDEVLAYALSLQTPVPYVAGSSPQEPAPSGNALLALLSSEAVGNPANAAHVAPSALAEHLARARAARLPLRFVVPAFPFKDQNPFRTGPWTPADHVDFGELALLLRLDLLGRAIATVHPFGAEWIIVSDGAVHAPTFGVAFDDARRYLARLRELRNRLGLRARVHLLDLAEFTDRDPDFRDVQRTIADRLASLAEGTARAPLDALARGMRRNLATRARLSECSAADLWSVIFGDGSDVLPPTLRGLRETLDAAAHAAALAYASFALAMRATGLLQRLLPGTIRATAHPKLGQVALPELGVLHPWNGVALASRRSGNLRVRVVAFHEVARIEDARAVLLADGSAPLYYERVDRS